MKAWRYLNGRGRLLIILCIMNVFLAVFAALRKDVSCFFSLSVAAFCGIATYSNRCDRFKCNEDGEVF